MSERRLEDMTIDEFWRLYLNANPPPDEAPPEEIEFVRQIYMAGFGAMLMVMRRLEKESPERIEAVLNKLEADLWANARALAGHVST